MTSIERSALVPYSAEQMFRLVDDIERYPAFMQGCIDARVLERTESEVIGELTLGKAGIRRSFSTRNHLQPPHRMEMELVEGPFSDFSAIWTFDVLSETACRVTLRMRFTIAGGLMGMALNRLFEHSANALVDDIVSEAGRLYGKP